MSNVLTDDFRRKMHAAANDYVQKIDVSDRPDVEIKHDFVSGYLACHNRIYLEIEKLMKFKQYVHDRLDKMGIPVDPEPEKNAAHGCRIEGRLNVVERLLGNNVA